MGLLKMTTGNNLFIFAEDSDSSAERLCALANTLNDLADVSFALFFLKKVSCPLALCPCRIACLLLA